MRVCERFRTILLGQQPIIPNSTSKIDCGKASSAPESITCILKVHILNTAVLIQIYIVQINFFLMYYRIQNSITERGGSVTTLALKQIINTAHPNQLVNEQSCRLNKLHWLIQLYRALKMVNNLVKQSSSFRLIHSFIHSFIHFLYFPSILDTRYGKRHVHNTNSYRNIYLKKIKNKQNIYSSIRYCGKYVTNMCY